MAALFPAVTSRKGNMRGGVARKKDVADPNPFMYTKGSATWLRGPFTCWFVQ